MYGRILVRTIAAATADATAQVGSVFVLTAMPGRIVLSACARLGWLRSEGGGESPQVRYFGTENISLLWLPIIKTIQGSLYWK